MYDEDFRLQQKGMGYLQWHAAVSWMRAWLKANKATFTEHGDTGSIRPLIWEVRSNEGSFWVSFDRTSIGHLLFSLNREDWQGMDVTYHSAEDESGEDTWEMVCRRIAMWSTRGPVGPTFKMPKGWG